MQDRAFVDFLGLVLQHRNYTPEPTYSSSQQNPEDVASTPKLTFPGSNASLIKHLWSEISDLVAVSIVRVATRVAFEVRYCVASRSSFPQVSSRDQRQLTTLEAPEESSIFDPVFQHAMQ